MRQRDVVVLADALQDEKGRGRSSRIRDEMRPAGAHRIALARLQAHFFLRIAEEEPDLALEHVEGVLHVRVVVPRHLLRGRDLQLADPEPRALVVPGPALDFIEGARILHGPADLAQLILFSFPAHSLFRRTNFWTFPVDVFGRSPNSTAAGHLKCAITER